MKNEDAWIASEREKIISYLVTEGVEHRGVGEWPAFHVCPYLAVWVVQSKRKPGAVGWWAISGDTPTDYMSSAAAKHPREALAYFGDEWEKLSMHMAQGVPSAESRIGKQEHWPTLAPLLKTRAEQLKHFAADDELWSNR